MSRLVHVSGCGRLPLDSVRYEVEWTLVKAAKFGAPEGEFEFELDRLPSGLNNYFIRQEAAALPLQIDEPAELHEHFSAWFKSVAIAARDCHSWV